MPRPARRGPVLAVCGTRPEALKLAPVVAALRRRGVRVLLASTGQHRGLLDQALRATGLRPAFDLRLMRPGQDHGVLAARIVRGLAPHLERLRPALLLVQGDATTAAAAALAAAAAGVPVGHVEAGLRTGDLAQPFPEEGNRVLADRLSVLRFAPTPSALANLRREGLGGRWTRVTGNTAVDAVRAASREAGPRDAGCVLVTLHRRETLGARLEALVEALAALAARRPERFVFLVHPNPAVRRAARRARGRLRLARPMPYAGFVGLLKGARLVVTDSGGLQEEASALGRPVLVVRDKTERPELLASGGGRLVGRDPRRVAAAVRGLLEDPAALARMGRARCPFGDGRAGERIAALTAAWLRRESH